jgi:hypothetical protein
VVKFPFVVRISHTYFVNYRLLKFLAQRGMGVLKHLSAVAGFCEALAKQDNEGGLSFFHCFHFFPLDYYL